MSSMVEPISAQGLVYVDYAIFLLADPEQTGQPVPPATNGLVTSKPGIAVIRASASSGWVQVSLELREEPPAHVAEESWEEVVDHSVESLTGQMRVASLMDDPPDLPVLTPSGPGPYRIRIHAKGRDIAPDAVAEVPLEDYLLIIWPEAPGPEVVHKQTDQYGASLRAQAAVRRIEESASGEPAVGPVEQAKQRRFDEVRERQRRVGTEPA